MTTIRNFCDGIFIGQLLGSQCDPCCLLGLELAVSLLERQSFDGREILSRYLYLYHTKRLPLGMILSLVYEELSKKNFISNLPETVTHQHFRFDASTIKAAVLSVDLQCQHGTASCGPAHRSFPLALCSWISDDDLFEITLREAALTHYNPIAGQVAGIVNLICRSLLRNETWDVAINKAFAAPSLHPDILEVFGRYTRWNRLSKDLHPAYAPMVLNAALFHATNSSSFSDAIQSAKQQESSYVVTLTSILAAARWGVPVDLYSKHLHDTQLERMRTMADRLATLWNAQSSTTLFA